MIIFVEKCIESSDKKRGDAIKLGLDFREYAREKIDSCLSLKNVSGKDSGPSYTKITLISVLTFQLCVFRIEGC